MADSRRKKQRRVVRVDEPAIEAPRPKVRTLEDDMEGVDREIAALEERRERMRADRERLLAAQHAQDELRAVNRRCYWPKGKSLPDAFVKVKRDPVPCPRCRRMRMDDGSQATACTSSGTDVAWFRCKSCGHRFKMPVKEVG